MSASIRVQCGPAIVVEKSRTRRPAKLPVKFPSSLPAMVIPQSSLGLSAFVFTARRDPKWSRHRGEGSRVGNCLRARLEHIVGQIGPVLASDLFKAGRGHFLKVLFVTTEMDDFVRVGGLAAVSAALPRALRPWSDVRIMLPGYRDVVEQFTHIEIVGQCAALAEMPACSLGRASTRDGLPVYVLLCPQLYDRPGNPYGDESGRDWPDNDVRFGRFASAAAELAMGTLDKNWAADLVHANDWQAALVPAYLAWKRRQDSLDPDHPQSRLSGPVSAGVAAPDRRARKLLPHRWPRILRQAVVPQGRHRLRLASDHRQRDLCQGDHDARTRLRARRSAAAALGRRATDRHPERHRRKLGSARLRATGAAVWRRRLGGQAGQRRLRPQAVRPGAVARPDFRSGRPSGSPEGHRSRTVRRRRDHRGRRADRRHRQRRARRSSRRWSMRIAAGRTRSGSPSASTTGRRGEFSPAAILR